MNEKLRAVCVKFKADKKLRLIFIAVLLGLILLIFGSEKKISDQKPVTADGISFTSEEKRLEEKLEKLLSGVDGVGKVKVLVTLQSLEEHILAENTEEKNENGKISTKNEYVLTGQSGDKDGLTLKVIMPVIRGVAIACEGGDTATVKQEIIKTVTAGLGIPSNHVWVTKLESDGKNSTNK